MTHPSAKWFVLLSVTALIAVAWTTSLERDRNDVVQQADFVRILRDEQEHLGPLAGMAVGLRALVGEVEAAFVSSCDVPLLRPEFITEMVRWLGSHELAVPKEGDFHHPLAAVYRTSLAESARQLVVAQRLRPLFLIQASDSVEVPVDELRRVDPELHSLRNLNRPEDYEAALRLAGLAE